MAEDYKAMYLTLFNKVTEIIEELKDIQAKTEAMYINVQDDKTVEEQL